MELFLYVVAIGVTLALFFHGWPTFFNITVHKHYHGRDKDGAE
jgi:hypothetical protein